MSSCDFCGHWFEGAPGTHGCAESKPNPNLVERLRDDHTDTAECQHGFNLYEGGGCPNVICLARDLREAVEEIERLRARVGGEV